MRKLLVALFTAGIVAAPLAPSQAQPLCKDPVGACDELCRRGIVC